MGAVIDILFLKSPDISILRSKYSKCVIYSMDSQSVNSQRYRIIIPEEDVEDYYGFLVDNMIAMSSTNFRLRLESDLLFKDRMTNRASALLRAMDKKNKE